MSESSLEVKRGRRDELAKALPFDALIEAIERCLHSLTVAPQRLVLSTSDADWIVMPIIRSDGGLVCKMVRAAHERSPGATAVAGVVVLLSASGDLEVILDAEAFTARRTAAVAALATRHLANANASVLALFGAGALAAAHIEALDLVRPLSDIRVVARTTASADLLVEKLRRGGWNARRATASQALKGAEIVSTLTTSPVPVFSDAAVEAGAHINAIGAYRPDRREIPSATIARARVVVETRASALREAGDLLIPLAEGIISDNHIVATLADDLNRVRTASSDVTLFKSVGHAAFDLAAADLLRHRSAS